MKTKLNDTNDVKEMLDSHLVDLEDKIRKIGLRLKFHDLSKVETEDLKLFELELRKHRKAIHELYVK